MSQSAQEIVLSLELELEPYHTRDWSRAVELLRLWEAFKEFSLMPASHWLSSIPAGWGQVSGL